MASILINLSVSIIISLVSWVAILVGCFYICRFCYRYLSAYLLKLKIQKVNKKKIVKAVEKPTWFFSTLLKHYCKIPFVRRKIQELYLPILRYITKLMEQAAKDNSSEKSE